jgi:ABC transport system ATP-binding/permease protein
VLLVSHDRAFLDNIVTSTLAFEKDGRVREYVGGWQDYLRQSAGSPARAFGGPQDRSRAQTAPGAAAAPQRASDAEGAARRKLSYKEQRELETLPPQIESLEGEQAALKAEMESPEFYKAGAERIQTVMSRLETVARELEEKISRWMELEERR